MAEYASKLAYMTIFLLLLHIITRSLHVVKGVVGWRMQCRDLDYGWRMQCRDLDFFCLMVTYAM